MKITRWASGGHFVFFLKKPRGFSPFPLAMSAMRNSTDSSGWFKVVMSKHGQKKVKEVQPPAFKPTASLPVVSPVVPATKALPALSLLGMLGLLLVSAPMDGNCYLHCAVCILKKADSKTLSSCSAREVPVNTESPQFKEFVDCVFNTVKSSGVGGCLIEQLHFGMYQRLHQSLKYLLQEDHFIALLQAAVAAKIVLESNLIFTCP